MIWLPGVLSQGGKKGIQETFADNDWETIITACKTKEVPETWVVGDQKAMAIGGANYLIDIIGINHDTYASGGTAPLTFQLHDCYATKYGMNSGDTNSGGWESCAMRNTHLPAIFLLMPNEVQDGITEVSKLTSAGNKDVTIKTTSDKLFLLSESEIWEYEWHTNGNEGDQYPYYKQGTYGNRPKKIGSTVVDWWWRSPDINSSTNFCYTFRNYNGAAQTSNAFSKLGISPAFCF